MKALKSVFIALTISFFMYSCSSVNNTSNESINDGSSIEKAIKVKSVEQEYTIVREKCPDCKMVSQGLTSKGNKHYDHLIFKKADGEEVHYFFDINSFYGKW